MKIKVLITLSRKFKIITFIVSMNYNIFVYLLKSEGKGFE